MKRILSILAVAWAATLPATPAWSHCQVPCGIYDDEVRFDVIDEDCATIEKAMTQIRELSADPAANMNQIVRWVATKEEHAQKVQDVVSAYFLTQRVSPVAAGGEGYEDYLKSLELCHGLLFNAMKCKQTLDASWVEKLRGANADYRSHYFKDHQHE
jgi:nickel superoxide dismutase